MQEKVSPKPSEPRKWELRGLEKASGVIISWRFPFKLKKLETIPKKEPNDPDFYTLLRMTEAREMGLTEEQLMAERKSIADSGIHVIEFGIRIMPREHRFIYGVVTGGRDTVQELIAMGFKPIAIQREEGISQARRQKDKPGTDYKVSLLLMKTNKKKSIELPSLLEELYSERWCCHIWDNIKTKNKNFTINYVYPVQFWRRPPYTIVPLR